MIIGSFFGGDEDKALANMQHDVYGYALRIIVRTCNRFARFSIAVLNDTEHHEWGQVEECDHRTLQGAHDLLAAAWRYSNDSRQGTLPFPEEANMPTPETRWLEWLQAEISAWMDAPQLVRSVQLILTNQNEPIGYLAESRLCLGIMYRFDSVPWEKSWSEAYESGAMNKCERFQSKAEDEYLSTIERLDALLSRKEITKA